MADTPLTARTRVAAAGAAALALLAVIGGACTREPERSVAAYCAEIKNVVRLNEVAASGDVTAINQQLDRLRQVESVAPPEVQPQIATLVTFFDDYAKTVRTAKNPDAALEDVARRRPNDSQAAIGVNAYSRQQCNIDLSGTSAPGTALPGTATSSNSIPGSSAPPP